MRVRFERVAKRFGAHHAVDGISLDVESGECLVLLGPSGCGKTTLLRLLAGLEPLDAGEIWIGDRRVDQLEPARRDVAMVFQNYALYPHLSVFDNIAFPLRTRHVEGAEIDRRVREAAARVGLADLLARRPAQLSGGQQQRVALVQIGAPLELYRQPVNAFVATFLGSPPMNLIEESRNGTTVRLGIRAEDVVLTVSAREGAEQARVVVVEPMGSETLVTLE